MIPIDRILYFFWTYPTMTQQRRRFNDDDRFFYQLNTKPPVVCDMLWILCKSQPSTVKFIVPMPWMIPCQPSRVDFGNLHYNNDGAMGEDNGLPAQRICEGIAPLEIYESDVTRQSLRASGGHTLISTVPLSIGRLHLPSIVGYKSFITYTRRVSWVVF